MLPPADTRTEGLPSSSQSHLLLKCSASDRQQMLSLHLPFLLELLGFPQTGEDTVVRLLSF